MFFGNGFKKLAADPQADNPCDMQADIEEAFSFVDFEIEFLC